MLCIRCRREIPDDSRLCCYCGKRQAGVPAPQRRQRRRPRGQGSVWKDPRNHNRPWVARAGDGTYIGCFAEPSEAVRELDAVNARLIAPDRQMYTLSDVYDRWSALHFPKITKSAQQSYQNAYRKAEPLQGRRMMDLKTEDYQEIITAMAARQASRSLCEKQRQLFSQLCQYAMRQDIIHTNYAQGLVLPSASAPQTRVLSDFEVQSIWRLWSMTNGWGRRPALRLC